MTDTRFDNENSTDEGQQQLLLDDDRYHADRSSQGERAHVAHEDLGGMRVVPEKADGRADHRSAEDRHFGHLRHARQFEIVGKLSVPADVGEHGQRTGRDHRASDRQAVEAVSEIDGVGRSHKHERHEEKERQESQRPQVRVLQAADHQVGPEVLGEGDDQPRGVQRVFLQTDQRGGNQERHQKLVEELAPASEPKIAAMDNFQVVVGETDASESQHRQNCHPDEAVAQVGPQQRWHHGRNHDQDASHGRSAGLGLVRLGTVLADILANLELAQAANHSRSDHQPHKQRGQTGEGSAKRQVAEDAERTDMKNQKPLLVEQPIEQILPR